MTRAIATACVWVLLAGALVLAWRHSAAAQPIATAPDQIGRWLECDECSDGELAAVVAVGPPAVPSLSTILREGLPLASRKELERQLVQRFAARAAWAAKTHAGTLVFSREAYIAHHLGNRDALYRARAALALGRIATPEAEQALRAALAIPQRPSVAQAIRHALDPRPAPARDVTSVATPERTAR